MMKRNLVKNKALSHSPLRRFFLKPWTWREALLVVSIFIFSIYASYKIKVALVTPKIEEVYVEFYDHLDSQRYEQAYEFMSQSYRNRNSVDQFEAEFGGLERFFSNREEMSSEEFSIHLGFSNTMYLSPDGEPVGLLLILIKEDNQWKVDGLTLWLD